MTVLFWLVFTAVLVHGLIAGISFDVATVKLPTRKRIGVIAYAQFARGNDMGNGIIVYPAVAILALLLVAAATITAYFTHALEAVLLPLFAACGGTIAHFLCTAKAAPNMLSLRNAADDEVFLARKLDAFATWHAYRTLFPFLTFVALVWALTATTAPKYEETGLHDLSHDVDSHMLSCQHNPSGDGPDQLKSRDLLA